MSNDEKDSFSENVVSYIASHLKKAEDFLGIGISFMAPVHPDTFSKIEEVFQIIQEKGMEKGIDIQRVKDIVAMEEFGHTRVIKFSRVKE